MHFSVLPSDGWRTALYTTALSAASCRWQIRIQVMEGLFGSLCYECILFKALTS